ncbi:DNA-protecting protein DprA [bacterium]|nr:DNA-protecting protein DprA [bacterium]
MQELDAWILLSKLEISPRKRLALLQAFNSPQEIFQATREALLEVQGITEQNVEKIFALAREGGDKEKMIMEKVGAKIITILDPKYPPNLKEIYDPPIVLYVRGEIKEEDKFAVAIVGTRRPTQYGRSVAYKLASELVQRGFTVVSGLARGIDASAHRGALEGGGRTIAVLGCGIDIAYPMENKELMDEIARKGAIVSEFAPGTPPQPWHFPVRNRIISGLSLGTVMVQAPEGSGALITADLALEQGREVFAVPGNIEDPRSKGPHQLIKEGAKLVEFVEDIITELGIPSQISHPAPAVSTPNLFLPPEEEQLLKLLSYEERYIGDISRDAGLPPSRVASILTMLELKGLVKRLPGDHFVLAG